MDKLLHEGEVRFEEKLEIAKRGGDVNLSGQFSDKTYNLLSQVHSNPILEKDGHLMSMIEDIEKHTNSDYILKGDVERKFASLVCCILKSLLREALSTNDAGSRKINIEKCWTWYTRKMQMILNWKLERMTSLDAVSHQPERASFTPPDSVSGAPIQGKIRKEDIVKRSANVNPVIKSTHPAKLDFMVREVEAQQQTAITKKLEKHLENMVENMKARKEQRTVTSIKTETGLEVPPVSTSEDKQESEQPKEEQPPPSKIRRRRVQASPLDDDIPPPAPPQPASRQYPRIIYTKQRLGGQNSTGPPTFVHSKSSIAAEKDVHLVNEKGDLIVEGKQQLRELLQKEGSAWNELQRQWVQQGGESNTSDPNWRLLEKSLANIHKVWVANRTRDIETTIENREFMDTLAMWGYNHARIEEEINRRHESSTVSSQTGRTHHLIRSSESTRPKTAEPRQSLWDNIPQTTTTKPVRMSHSTLPNGEPNPSLSAYDHREITMFDKILQDKNASENKKTLDDDFAASITKHGLKAVSKDLVVGTAGTNVSLDITPDKFTAFAPSMKRTYYGTRKSNLKHEKSSKKKPSAKQTDPPVKKVETDEDRQRKAALFQWLFPTTTVVEEVPSLRRLQQQRTISKIKDCLVKHNLHIPTSAIEDGILTPEYQPYLECIGNLPPRDSGFSRSWDKLQQSKPKKTKTTAPKQPSGKKRKKK